MLVYDKEKPVTSDRESEDESMRSGGEKNSAGGSKS